MARSRTRTPPKRRGPKKWKMGLAACTVVLAVCYANLGKILSLWQGGAVSWSPASVDWICAAMFAAALFVLRKWKPNPIWVMVGCGVLGAIIFPFLG